MCGGGRRQLSEIGRLKRAVKLVNMIAESLAIPDHAHNELRRCAVNGIIVAAIVVWSLESDTTASDTPVLVCH